MQIIDVRSEEEYSGATSHGNMRAGHVPGAVHLEWSDFRDPGHPELLKSVEEREALLQVSSLDPCGDTPTRLCSYFVHDI